MSKKMIWGFGVLMLLICTAFVYMIVRDLVEIRQLKEKADAIQKPSEDSNKQKPVVKANEQPPAEQGFKWVWHNDHWDKVPVVNPSEPIEHTPTPSPQNTQTSQKNDLSKYYGKPLDEDFFRDNFSREELESMLKADQRSVEHMKTQNIPRLEEHRKQYLELLQGVPENISEHLKKGLADTEAQINQYKFEIEILERHIALMLKVLNEEVNNVEK